MKKAVLTGGTGFVGQALIPELKANHIRPFLLSRSPLKDFHTGGAVWSGQPDDLLTQVLSDTDIVLHLAGESLFGLWSREKKRRIMQSRVGLAKTLVTALRAHPNPSSVTLLSVSGVGYYGNAGDKVLNEFSPKGRGFLPDVCAAWEQAILSAQDLGVRVIVVRLGVVLGDNGGMLPLLTRVFKAFLGGHFGNGNQWLSWVSIQDLVKALLFLLENPQSSGIYNLVSPSPIQLKLFCKQLGHALGRPSWLHMPEPLCRLLLRDMSALVLDSARVYPEALLKQGFVFSDKDLPFHATYSR